MADEMMPVPVEGRASMRRLGVFEGVDEPEHTDDEIDALASAQRARALTQVILLGVGALCITIGVTALWGWPWGLLMFGTMTIAVGVLLDVGNFRAGENVTRGK